MPRLFHARLSRRDSIVPLLAVAGGSIDAIGLLGLGVLTAAQTGNTIRFAASLAEATFAEVLFSGVSLGGYVSGAALGTVLVGRRVKDEHPRMIRHALLVETALAVSLERPGRARTPLAVLVAVYAVFPPRDITPARSEE